MNDLSGNQGVSITLKLSSKDRLHGFNIFDLGLLADVLPGQSAQVELLPEKAGTYSLLFDIFCGDGQNEMSGVIVVND